MTYIDTIAPIPIDCIKEYFKDKNIMFLIDYENSKLENKVFLTYLSNLDVPCDLKLDSLSKEKKLALLEAYLDIKNIVRKNRVQFIAPNKKNENTKAKI